MELFVRRDHGDRSRSLPRLPWDYEKIKSFQMRDALKLVTANKVEEAIVALREILHILLLFAAANKAEADDVAKTVETIREYIVALSVEVARRGLDVSTPEGIKRNLELAAYFTNFQLTAQHRGLAYQQAMAQFNKYKNIATAGVFAQKYVALGIGKPDAVERVWPLGDSFLMTLGEEDCCVGSTQYARHH
jgi:coatomer protein complex subunit alpha (xenin)